MSPLLSRVSNSYGIASLSGFRRAFLGRSGGAAGYEIERSLRFNLADSAYIQAPTLTSGKDTYTISLWVKRTEFSTYNAIYSTGTTSSGLFFDGAGGVSPSAFYSYFNSVGGTTSYTNELHRDPSAWYHIVVSVNSSIPTIYVNGVVQTKKEGQSDPNFGTLTDKLYFGIYSDSLQYPLDGYMADIHFIDGQALDETDFGEFDATTGAWNPIRYAGTYGSEGFHLPLSDNSSVSALGTDDSGNGNHCTLNNFSALSNPQAQTFSGYFWTQYKSTYNDNATAQTKTGSKYRIALDDLFSGVVDGTNYTAAELFGIDRFNSQGYIHESLTSADGTATTGFGNSSYTGSFWKGYFDYPNNSGKYASITLYDGSAVDGTDFGINRPDCDSLLDSPTNGDTADDTGLGGEVLGNYCTWNPLSKYQSSTDINPENGNLEVAQTPSGYAGTISGTIAIPKTGKWYWEVGSSTSSFNSILAGLETRPQVNYAGSDNGVSVPLYAGGSTYAIAPIVVNSPAPTWAIPNSTSDIFGFAIDMDAGEFYLYYNGVIQNNGNYIANGLDQVTEPLFPSMNSTSGCRSITNFGQRPFAYPLTGYKALCTANLDDPTIEDGSTAMDVVTYSGNSSNQTISGLNFSPDFVWIKNRSDTTDHFLADTVRGAGYFLYSNLTNEENYDILYKLQAFNSDGFDLGGNGQVNGSGDEYVAWTWDAGTPQIRTHTQPKLYTSTTLYTTAADVVANATARNGGESITDEYVYLVTNSGGRIGEGVFNVAGSLSNIWYILLREGASWDSWGSYNNTNGTDWSLFQWKQDFVPSSSTYTCANNVELHMISDSTSPGTLSGTLPTLATTTDDGAVVNTSGDIESRVRANPSTGFSIVKWTSIPWTGSAANRQVGHGLNAAPAFIITKGVENAAGWYCYHKDLDATSPEDWYITLNTTDARATLADSWGPNKPDSTTFGDRLLGFSANQSAIAYCWAPVKGYSAFGRYTGTGLVDGPFVYTGFRPAWIMIKQVTNTDANCHWFIFDTTRKTYNVIGDEALVANKNWEEGLGSNWNPNTSDSMLDILSNGFKIRTTSTGGWSVSNETYIYAAFAEHPQKYSRAR